MARKIINPIEYKKARKKRPGIHAKTKTSKLKSSKLYKKLNTGQGKWQKKEEQKETKYDRQE